MSGRQGHRRSLRPALEDRVGAGAILAGLDPAALSDAARDAVAAYRAVQDRLSEAVEASMSGRELADAGFGADVTIACEVDATATVPVLRDGAFAAA